MINQEVEDVIGKLRRCRPMFYVSSVLSALLAAFMALLVFISLGEAAYVPAAVCTSFALLFLWSICIFIREDRVLSGIVSEVRVVDDALVCKTIFSEQCSLASPDVVALGPEWIRKRRWWPPYFLRGVDAVQYARQPSKIVKAVMIQADGSSYFWISTDTGPISEYFSVKNDGAAASS